MYNLSDSFGATPNHTNARYGASAYGWSISSPIFTVHHGDEHDDYDNYAG
ncbi:hypothetical protein ACGE24_04500 [Corynebacterium kroppenstedtii]